MGMKIKDTEVHAMARQLAARRGTTVTNVVRMALSAELERCQATDAARQEELHSLLDRFRRLPWPEGVSGKDAQNVLYDATRQRSTWATASAMGWPRPSLPHCY